jgi:hypothetical protein
MATKTNAGDNSNVNKVNGPIASSAKKTPKPAPSPTSYKQLNIDMATLAMVPKGPNGEDLKFSKSDPNTYSGTYKGKRYTWQSGGFLK